MPARTAIATPLQTNISFPNGDVERVDIYIPAGHAGLTGFQLANAHQPVIPFDTGEYIIGENERLSYPLEGYGDSGSWQMFAYNLDQFNHTFYVTFLLKIVRQAVYIVGGPNPYVAPATGDEGGGAYIAVPPETGGGTTPVEPSPDDTPPDETEPDVPDDTAPDTPDETTPTAPDEPLTGTPDEPALEPPLETPPAAEIPAEPPPPPPAPPTPKGSYFELWGWQTDGDIHVIHWYSSGPRQNDVVLIRKYGWYPQPPGTLPANFRNDGWNLAGPPIAPRWKYAKIISTASYY